jgi:hypothetical protein
MATVFTPTYMIPKNVPIDLSIPNIFTAQINGNGITSTRIIIYRVSDNFVVHDSGLISASSPYNDKDRWTYAIPIIPLLENTSNYAYKWTLFVSNGIGETATSPEVLFYGHAAPSLSINSTSSVSRQTNIEATYTQAQNILMKRWRMTIEVENGEDTINLYPKDEVVPYLQTEWNFNQNISYIIDDSFPNCTYHVFVEIETAYGILYDQEFLIDVAYDTLFYTSGESVEHREFPAAVELSQDCTTGIFEANILIDVSLLPADYKYLLDTARYIFVYRRDKNEETSFRRVFQIAFDINGETSYSFGFRDTTHANGSEYLYEMFLVTFDKMYPLYIQSLYTYDYATIYTIYGAVEYAQSFGHLTGEIDVVNNAFCWALINIDGTKKYVFDLNLQSDAITNKTSYKFFDNYTKYPAVAQIDMDYITGKITSFPVYFTTPTLDVAISGFNSLQKQSFLNQIRAFINNKESKLLKDRKGNLMMVYTTDFGYKLKDEIEHQIADVSFAYTEVSDVDEFGWSGNWVDLPANTEENMPVTPTSSPSPVPISIRMLTQAEYDAIGTGNYSAGTLYFVS